MIILSGIMMARNNLKYLKELLLRCSRSRMSTVSIMYVSICERDIECTTIAYDWAAHKLIMYYYFVLWGCPLRDHTPLPKVSIQRTVINILVLKSGLFHQSRTTIQSTNMHVSLSSVCALDGGLCSWWNTTTAA